MRHTDLEEDLGWGDSVTTQLLEAWNSLDPARIAAMHSEGGSHEDVATGKVYKGRAAIKALVAESTEASSDFRLTLVTEQVSGDRYAIEWEGCGTNTGEMSGMPPTNKILRFRGASIGQVDADGKIKENRDYYNMADIMTQLGLLPTPEG